MFAWLSKLDHYLPIRYAVWALCIVGFIASAVAWWQMGMSLWLVVVFAALVLLGARDLTQARRSERSWTSAPSATSGSTIRCSRRCWNRTISAS